MNAIRRQFFFSYAALGSVMPLVTVFLREQGGFNFLQIGMAMALMGLPTLFSPAILTMLADRNVDARRILAIACTCSATVLSLMFFSEQIGLTLILFVFHGLASVAMLPIQDGYYFSLVEICRRQGGKIVDYPMIRVWGTIGYILPSLLLYYPLLKGAEPRLILPCAVIFCLFALANSFTLSPISRLPSREKPRLPSRAALRAIFAPNARWLSIGLFFAFLAAASYYAFIGNYLDEIVRVPKAYIPLIISLGVVAEVICTLLMPRLHRKIGLKGIMVVGLGCMVTRMLVLSFFPFPLAATLAQLGHGFEVIALYVSPVMFLNRLAEDNYRNSIQGIYTMMVSGTTRVLGSLAAGLVAAHFGLRINLLWGAGLAACAFFIIAFLFERIPPREEVQEIRIPPDPHP